MDFNNLESVGRANATKNRTTTWKFKRAQRANGPTFTFAQDLVDRLDLAHNSLKQEQDPNGQGDVYVVVCPGNEGVWAKSTGKGTKGNSFKNEELAKSLDIRGVVAEKLDLSYVGINPTTGNYYYKVVPFGDVVDTTPVSWLGDNEATGAGQLVDEAGQPDEARDNGPMEEVADDSAPEGPMSQDNDAPLDDL